MIGTIIGVRLESELGDEDIAFTVVEQWMKKQGGLRYEFGEIHKVNFKVGATKYNEHATITDAFREFMTTLMTRLNKQLKIVDTWDGTKENYFVMVTNVSEDNIVYSRRKMIREGEYEKMSLKKFFMYLNGIIKHIKQESFEVVFWRKQDEAYVVEEELTQVFCDSLVKR